MESRKTQSVTLFLDIAAAYNREVLPLPESANADTETMAAITQLVSNPSRSARMTDQETEDVLLELYIARRRRAQ